MGLRQIFGTSPLGDSFEAPWEEVIRHLKAKYMPSPFTTTVGSIDQGTRGQQRTDAGGVYGESRRRQTAIDAVALYEGDDERLRMDALGAAFRHKDVIAKHRQLAPYAEYNRVTRRLVDMLARMYAAPAVRRVKDPGQNERYQKLQEETGQNQSMRQGNRMDVLCGASWLNVSGTPGECPELDAITPGHFTLIAHPHRPRRYVGVILDMIPDGLRVRSEDPHYQVWSADEWFYLDKNWNGVGPVNPNPLGMLPGVLIQSRKPVVGLLNPAEPKDVIAAHLATFLLNVMTLKRQKSGTRFPVATGDTSNTATGQALDEEVVFDAGSGVTISTIDLGQDPGALIAATRAVIAQAAAAKDIPEDIFLMSGAFTSAQSDLMRESLAERRLEQVDVYRPAEKQLAKVLSRWIEVYGPSEYAFTLDGWRVDFQEVARPMDPMTKAGWREKQRHLGLSNPVAEIMEDNPDLTVEQAFAELDLNVEILAKWVEKVRALNVRTDATPEDPGQTAQDNGRMGGRPEKKPEPGDEEYRAPMPDEKAA